MLNFCRLSVFAAVAAATLVGACGDSTPHFFDANSADANGYDAQVVDTTPPDTIIDSAPAALTKDATATITFHSTEAGSTFTCSLDGASPQPCSSPFTMAVADGAHTFGVVATDAAGNTDTTPATASWTVDTMPPDTTITAHPPAVDNSVNVEFDFTSEVGATFECAVDNGAFAACTSPDLLTALAAGAHTFAVRAIDAAGNVDPTPATWSWTIDTSTPDTQIDSGPSGTVAQPAATFTFSSPNAGAGATFACTIDGGASTACTSPISFTGLVDGDHTFTVAVTNAAGTSDPTPATRTWTVDTTPPTAMFTGGPSGPTNVNTPSFPFVTGGNPVLVECALDTGAFAACTSPFALGVTADGPHAVHLRATDAAGNQGVDNRTFAIDTRPPTVTIVSGPASPTNQTSGTFTFFADETPVTFACSLDGATYGACASGLVISGLTDGPHMLFVRATDAAGNVSVAPAQWSWTVDTQPPTVVIDTQPANPTNQTGATFTFHSPDGGTAFTCQLDGGTAASCASGQSYTGLTGGAGTSHTFAVKATDGAGNVGTSTTYTWKIDTQPPTVVIDTKPASLTNATGATFTFHSADGGTAFTCQLDGGAAASCASGQSYTGLAGGAGTSHTFNVKATDAAGNTGASATWTWTIDTQPPTVTIDTHPAALTNATTASFTFHSADGGTAYLCSLDGAPFTACTSPQAFSSLTGGAAQGHSFAVEASDPAGNTGSPTTFSWTIDTVGPTVVIDSGPAKPTKQTTAQFAFHSADGALSYECAMDAGAFGPCNSGVTFTGLTGGPGTNHTFRVRGTDQATNTGSPSTYSWVIDTVAPDTAITISSEPANPTPGQTATLAFTSTESPSTFACTLDGSAVTCTGGSYATPTLAAGSHTFTVAATDAALNTDATPASYTWLVDPRPPTLGAAPAADWPVDYYPFSISGPQPSVAYQCATVVTGPYNPCTSPYSYTGASFTAANNLFVRWVDAKGVPSTTATVSWQPTAGLVLYYALDADVKNRSALARVYDHGATGGAYAFSGGYAGGAIQVQAPAIAPNVIAPLSERTGYTISLWVYWQSGQTPMQGTLLDTRGAQGGCTLHGDGAGNLALDCAGAPDGDLGSISTTVPGGRWVDVLVRYAQKGAPIELFVDGNAAGSIANPKGDDVFSSTQSGKLAIGDTQASGTTEWLVDDVRIWDTASADDASQCATYMNGTWTGQNCIPLMPSIDYAMESYPPRDSGSWGAQTIADFTYVGATGVYGNAIQVPNATAFQSSFSPGVNSGHTFVDWFYDDGSGNTGYLLDDLCPGAPGCGSGFIGGVSVQVANGTLTLCGIVGGLQTSRCASTPYLTKQWYLVTVVENAHNTGDGWATDSLDLLLDGVATAVHLDFTDMNSSMWYGGAPFTFAPAFNPTQSSGVYSDELKAWQASRADYATDVQCTMFDGSTYSYADASCTAPPTSPPLLP